MRRFTRIIASLLTLAIMLSVCSCLLFPIGSGAGRQTIALAGEKKAVSYSDGRAEDYRQFAERLSDFSARLSAALYSEYGRDADKNLSFSPLSVYMALAIAAECSDGQTREQILSVIGMSYAEMQTHTSTLYALCNRSFTYTGLFDEEKISAFEELHNSVWLDDSISINTDAAKSVADTLNADIFSVDFGGEAEEAIKQYIKEKTHGLLGGDINMDADTVFALINTFYLKELWHSLGERLDKTDEKYSFQNTDGSRDSIYLLKSYYETGNIYNGENYTEFYARTSHGFNLHFFLPDEGVGVGEVFNEENISALFSRSDYGHIDDENKQLHYTRVLFPAFEAEFNEDIRGVLQRDFGITDMFSPEDADMSALCLNTGDNLYCTKVIHQTKLTVDDLGIEGAAITAIPGAGAAGPGEYEEVYHDLIIDRAFAFVLTDSFGTVLFSGVVNEVD